MLVAWTRFSEDSELSDEHTSDCELSEELYDLRDTTGILEFSFSGH